jgi:hypothetical protein
MPCQVCVCEAGTVAALAVGELAQIAPYAISAATTGSAKLRGVLKANVKVGYRDSHRAICRGRQVLDISSRPTHDTDIFVGDQDELAEVRWASLTEAEQLMQPYGMFGPVRDHLTNALR